MNTAPLQAVLRFDSQKQILSGLGVTEMQFLDGWKQFMLHSAAPGRKTWVRKWAGLPPPDVSPSGKPLNCLEREFHRWRWADQKSSITAHDPEPVVNSRTCCYAVDFITSAPTCFVGCASFFFGPNVDLNIVSVPAMTDHPAAGICATIDLCTNSSRAIQK